MADRGAVVHVVPRRVTLAHYEAVLTGLALWWSQWRGDGQRPPVLVLEPAAEVVEL